MAKVKYTGVLNKPINVRQGLIISDEDFAMRKAEELIERTKALFSHYRVDPLDDACWASLAMRLAIDHVPGFQYGTEKREKGAPTKWEMFSSGSTNLYLELYADIEVYKRRNPNHTMSTIFANLAKRPRWRDRKMKAVTLERRFRIFKKHRLWSMVKKAEKYDEGQDVTSQDSLIHMYADPAINKTD